MSTSSQIPQPAHDRPSEGGGAPLRAVYGGKQAASERLEALLAKEPRMRDAFPSQEITAAKNKPEVRLAQAVRMVMEGYGDRPALGQRARELVKDPATGRSTLRILPRFETISYRDLWARVRAVASEWHNHGRHPFKAGDFTCVLGFASSDYAVLVMTSIHLGGVHVPLQTSAPPRNHADIMAETGPRVLAASINYIEQAVDGILLGTQPQRLVVFDYDARDDDHRDRLEAAKRRLTAAGSKIVVDTLDALIERGKALPPAPLFVPKPDEDPLSALFYTSGSTGTPKGAMLTERLAITTWQNEFSVPVVTLSFMPMSHLIGNGYMVMALANGGTSYCAPKSDLSTLFEDFSLARPTAASMVPRVCELLHHHFLAEVDRRVAAGGERAKVEEAMNLEIREKLLGGRLLSVGCGSASLAPETYEWMKEMLGFHMPIGYSSTEIAGGTVMVDWKIQRPMVIGYKLDDVPELGYFKTDKPYPRGELLVKTERFMGGYYKRPDLLAEKLDADGYYRTGDVMAELGPDHLVFVDRRNNVIKLSQGEFVAISRLEAAYAHHPAIRQIYLYGTSERAFLLGVVVPDPSVAGKPEVKAEIRRALSEIAAERGLANYEVPRDFIVETEPFSQKNGLLTEVGKHQRPALRDHYAPRLEEMYARIARDQLDERRALAAGAKDRPVIETVNRAVQATLGVAGATPDAKFTDLGGDSLAALSFSLMLEEIFGVEVPVGVIIGPTGELRRIAGYIEGERAAGGKRPSFAKVHTPDASEVKASDLKLAKFIPEKILSGAPSLPNPADVINTVLLTGATGFLGRFQAISWLERLSKTGGKLILLARGADAADARRRVEAALDTDPALMTHFRRMAEKHLEVIPGDIGAPSLGLDDATWNRLAETVDAIAHPAAHVNHVLPYNQLFMANVVGTAELIRLALTTRRKHVHYVSTLGVMKFSNGVIDEDSDVRKAIPTARLDDSYANGYGASKWASEVLLREAHDLCGLPVAAFRPGMILAHSRYAGQLNVPDMFTRLLYSLAVTGVAPATFYAQDLSKGRPRAGYAGLTVDFLADVITAICLDVKKGFHTFNLSSPHDDGVSLDNFVDWMIEAGCDIKRIDNYNEWLSRIETAMHALPAEKQQQSMLAIFGPYRTPQHAGEGPALPAARFHTGAKAVGMDIPHITADLIKKYVADLRGLKLL